MKYFYALPLVFFSMVCFAQPFDQYGVLDGENDYFQANELLKQKDFTVEMFFRSCEVDFNSCKTLVTNDKNFLTGIIKQHCNGCDSSDVVLTYKECLTDGGPCGGCGSSGKDDCIGCSDWYYVVIQYDYLGHQLWNFWNGSGGKGLFVSCAELEAKSPLIIGKKVTVGDQGNYLSGYIDEVRVSDNMRYEVGDIPVPTAPFTVDGHTIALWHFDESDVPLTTIVDASGKGHDLLAFGGAYSSFDLIPEITGATEVLTNVDNLYSLQELPPGVGIEWFSPGGELTATGNANETLISWSDPGIYTVIVTGVNTTTGCENFTDSILVNVEQEVSCTAPISLNTKDITSSSAVISWSAVENASGYYVSYISNNSNSWINVRTPDEYVEVTDLAPATTYAWKVKAACGDGPSVPSNWSSGQHFTTALLKVSEDVSTIFEVSPNPLSAMSTIKFVLDNDSRVLLELFSLDGALVIKIDDKNYLKGEHEIKIENFQSVAAGMYLLRMQCDDGIEMKKLMIAN